MEMKRRKDRFAVMTAYDYPMARALDQAGIEVALVGDSLGMVVLGEDSTLGVTMDAMVHHTRAVAAGIEQALIVADLPFMSYQVSVQEALSNAGRLLKEGGAHAVKLEGGGAGVLKTVEALRQAGIAVMGHLGLTPQSVHALGGYRLQGKSQEQAKRILSEAKALEKAGAFAVVLEVVPDDLAKKISAALSIPTIGIGAGPFCDAQVQVAHDALGLSPAFVPKPAKTYDHFYTRMVEAFSQYKKEVSKGSFPEKREKRKKS